MSITDPRVTVRAPAAGAVDIEQTLDPFSARRWSLWLALVASWQLPLVAVVLR